MMLAFCMLAPFGDALAKLLGSVVPLLQILVTRFAVQALILYPLARRHGSPFALPARVLLFMYALHAGLGSCGFLRFVSL